MERLKAMKGSGWGGVIPYILQSWSTGSGRSKTTDLLSSRKGDRTQTLAPLPGVLCWHSLKLLFGSDQVRLAEHKHSVK